MSLVLWWLAASCLGLILRSSNQVEGKFRRYRTLTEWTGCVPPSIESCTIRRRTFFDGHQIHGADFSPGGDLGLSVL